MKKRELQLKEAERKIYRYANRLIIDTVRTGEIEFYRTGKIHISKEDLCKFAIFEADIQRKYDLSDKELYSVSDSAMKRLLEKMKKCGGRFASDGSIELVENLS